MNRLNDSPDYGFPEIGELGYLVEYLSEIGEGQHTGNGLIALSWSEIKAWMDMVGLSLSPFEVKTIRRLSICYVNQFYKSEGVDIGPPSIVLKKDYRETVAERLKAAFAIIKGGQE